MCDFENTMCTSSFGVDDSLRNTLTCKVGKFVQQVEVLKEDWSIRSNSHGVLIVVKWSTS